MDQGLGYFMISTMVIVFVLWIVYEDTYGKKAVFDETRKLYEQALTELKTDPKNEILRQKTLELGMQYSLLTQERKGVTVFDEAALMNDINAASAGTAVSAQPTPKADSKP
jgi:hypothetical protein